MEGRWKRQIRIFLLHIALALTFCASVPAATSTEYEIKAAFIHKIAKFVEWPDEPPADGNLRLCVLGQEPLDEVRGVLQGKKIGNLVWEVRPVDYDSNLKACRLLFIAASERGNIKQLQRRIEDGAVLTIGDTAGYAEQGVMVNFYLEEKKVRFEINAQAAKNASLNISAQLLELVRIIKGNGRKK